MRNLLLFLVPVLVAAQAGPKAPALDKAAMERYVRHLLLYPEYVKVTISDPESSDLAGYDRVLVTASTDRASEQKLFYVSRDGKQLFQTTVWQMDKRPFEGAALALRNSGRPVLGSADGTGVEIAVFSDFQCQFCKKEGETLRKELLAAFPAGVQLTFFDYPLPQHDWARKAATLGRCVYSMAPAKFWGYHDWVFAGQETLTPENFDAKAAEYQAKEGLDAAAVKQCMADPGVAAGIDQSIGLAKALGVTSTPTLYVNGRQIPGSVPWENLKEIIRLEMGYQAAAAAAEKKSAEACCMVEVPGLATGAANPVLPAIVPGKK